MKFMDAVRNTISKAFGSKDEQKITDLVYAYFEECRSAYAGEWNRLQECERYYLGRHWEQYTTDDEKEPRPVTPVIQSTIENVSADLMDNYPEATITAEGPEDELIALVLEEVIKQNHDAAAYVREYRKLAHDLLVGGYMVQEIGYDADLNKGLGGAFIRQVDVNNILIDPLVADIQDSRAVIKFEGLPKSVLEERYPDKKPLGSDQYVIENQVILSDNNVTKDTTKMVLLIEYWWREYVDGQYRVHMCKVAGGKVLEDSREAKPDGYYAHGQYPFVVTPLFLRKGNALGWGLVDMLKDRQMTADKLDQIVVKNAYMASRNKLLVTSASGFDEADLADWAKEVHVGESLNGITWFQTPPLPNYIMQYIESIRQGIKEESGSNDFSRGTTGGGVTAASAIMALQEMAGKRSRMAARQMQEAFRDAVRMEIEVEREYNILPREVLITHKGEKQKATFESALLQRQSSMGNEVPIEFFVSIKVQRENRWSQMAQNELVLQMVQMQVIRPDQAVELMQFEGKESILERNQEQQPQMPPEEMQLMQQQEQMAGAMQQLPTPDMAAENPPALMSLV